MTQEHRRREQESTQADVQRVPMAQAPIDLAVQTPKPFASPVPRVSLAQYGPTVQRAVVTPVLEALTFQRAALHETQEARTSLQRQVAGVQATLPTGAEEAALQRQQERATPPSIPSFYAGRPPPGTKPSFSDVAGLYAYEAAEVQKTDNGRGVLSQPLRAIQRRAVGQFATAYLGSKAPVLQRARELGSNLATVQRLPFGSEVASVVTSRPGGLPPSDLPLIQRALSEADADLSRQDHQDAQVHQLHALQRQLAEHEGQSEHQHVLQRVRERQGAGAPLPENIQRHLETGLNADLSRVRVHTDAEADQLAKGVQAKAFTTGQDIYFQQGQYQPNTHSGLALLGHEVTHTMQQAQGHVGHGIDPDAGLEAQAQQIGERLSLGGPVPASVVQRSSFPGTSLAIQRQTAPATTSPQAPPGHPDPKVLAQHLAQLLTGTRQPVASQGLASRLDAASTNRHLGHLQDAFGRHTTANLLAGTTRDLASIPPSAPDRMTLYTLPVLDQGAVAQVSHELGRLKAHGLLQPTLAAFQAQTGKSLYAVLGERVRDPQLRASLLKDLPTPISEAQLTRDAFLENLAVNFVYSNDSAGQMNAQDKAEERRGANASKLLDAFGYTAGEPLSGRWGLQMRIFTPIPGKARDKGVIIAFRGTEGIALDSKSNPEGAQDTMIGDFAQAQPGYNQFNANAAWIDRTIKAAAKGGRVTMIGHSLGGALAQIAAARYPQLTAGVVVFQAANISLADVQKVEAYNKAHPRQAIRSRSYRVDGDVVPTSGEATLPGEIYYFDRAARTLPVPGMPPPANEGWLDRQRRQAGEWIGDKKSELMDWGQGKLLANVPYLNAAAATKGHVVPMLSTYLRGHTGGPQDAQRRALLHYGQRDENELPHQVDDGKGGQRLQPPTESVQTVFSGDYPTSRDPRLRGEATRASAVPSAMDLTQGYAGVFRDNIAYNTVLGHLYALAQKSGDFKTFQRRASQVVNTPTLNLLPEDVALAHQLHLDKSPHANATAALRNLADFQRGDINEMTSGVPNTWPMRARDRANTYLFEKFDSQMAKYSPTPVLNDYQRVGPGGQTGHAVQVPPILREQLSDPIALRRVWSLFHPGQVPR